MRVVYKSSLLLISSLLVINQAIASPPRVAPEPLVPYGAAPPLLDEKAEQRLNLLEKKMGSNVIYELLETLNQIKIEISELREIAEQQEHQMNLLTKRQRSLYQDVDRRMLELEAGSSSSYKAAPVNNTTNSGYTSSGISANTASNSEGAADDPAQEQAAYTRSFNLLKEGNYSQAITAFRAFLKTYGSGKYADNAQYWLGEANYATRDYKTALVEFQKILTEYQDSPKRKDAELKIGFTYYELKDWAASRRALESVVAQFPGTTNARTATQRLDRLTREGR
ncbi:MAG: tol-pal system protein YbgF [Gammaproteobacteria bacterium]|nr:tol-pal system protein YbgF [Gammaproteobacteria bacterium]